MKYETLDLILFLWIRIFPVAWFAIIALFVVCSYFFIKTKKRKMIWIVGSTLLTLLMILAWPYATLFGPRDLSYLYCDLKGNEYDFMHRTHINGSCEKLTTDFGKSCTSSKDCQGECQIDNRANAAHELNISEDGYLVGSCSYFVNAIEHYPQWAKCEISEPILVQGEKIVVRCFGEDEKYFNITEF